MAAKSISGNNSEQRISHLVGFYTAIFTVIMTVVTFGFAITAIPVSGANCGDLCIEYPYLNTLSQFPEVDGHKIVKPHVVRAANRNFFREIHIEICAA